MADRYFSNLSLGSPEDDAKGVSHNGVLACKEALPTFPNSVYSVHDDLHQSIKALFALYSEINTNHKRAIISLTSLPGFNQSLLETCSRQDQGD